MNKFNINFLNDVFCTIKSFFLMLTKFINVLLCEDDAKRKEKLKKPTI